MLLLYLIPLALIVAADQITKVKVSAMELGQTVPGVKGLFDVTYVQNRGAAFGAFQGRKLLLVAVTLLVFAVIVAYVIKKRPTSKWLMWSLTLICAGGLGNLIDRVALGYVRDFIQVTFTRFPVFNIADCGVTGGAVMLALYILIEEHRRGEDDFDSDSGCPQ